MRLRSNCCSLQTEGPLSKRAAAGRAQPDRPSCTSNAVNPGRPPDAGDRGGELAAISGWLSREGRNGFAGNTPAWAGPACCRRAMAGPASRPTGPSAAEHE